MRMMGGMMRMMGTHSAWAVIKTIAHAVATFVLRLCILGVVVPLALLVALLAALEFAWWHIRGRRFCGGSVLATRWIVLPSAVRGRTIAVRKDMREAISGGWWCIQIGTLSPWLWDGLGHLIPDPPLLHRTGGGATTHSKPMSLPPAAALAVAQGCRSCLRDGHHDVVDALLAESSAAAHLAAARIQRAWRGAIADPERAVCRARLTREFAELAARPSGGGGAEDLV